MKASLTRITLLTTACIAVLSPLHSAQAQSGYDYLFWPFFTLTPAVTAPSPAAALTVHRVTREVRDADSRAARDAEIKYARTVDFPKPTYGGPQSAVFGVGY